MVGLYLNPRDRAIMLCITEKSQVQALDRSQPLLPMTPGQGERHTHDDARHGTTSLFAALDVATGKIIGKCPPQHRHQEFIKFLELIDERTPEKPGTEIHLVMDNYATHKTRKVKRWFARHPRYHVHFMPTSSSWLNQVERFFAEIREIRIRRGASRSVQALCTAIEGYLDNRNRTARPFAWTAAADWILARVKKV